MHDGSNATDAPAGEVLQADVLVVGGGLVGLSLGIGLAQGGLDVVVVDREAPTEQVLPAFDGRVSAIAYASRRALEALGIWQHVAEAEPILDIRVTDGDSPLFVHYDHREVGPEPFGHIVENRHLRLALQAVSAETKGLTLLAPAAVKKLDRGPTEVEALLADGRRVRAALAVGAEGRQSPTRDSAGIRTTTWSYGQVGIVCTVRHEKPHRGVAQERFLPAGPFAILPMTGNRSSLVWTERADLAPALLALPEHEFLAEMAKRFGDYLGKLEVEGPRWSYPLSFLHAERYVAHRLALAGDAAHGIHPISGQGLNLGLRDVATLIEILVGQARLGLDIGDPLALEAYERWRRVDVFVLGAITDGLNRLFSNDIAPVRLIRDVGLGIVEQIPPLKRVFMRHARGDMGELPRLLRGEPV
jgi:2-octaprenyl-6-methoxyphenol hydroxylase